jgi:membrane associated rhomboid family serine protease
LGDKNVCRDRSQSLGYNRRSDLLRTILQGDGLYSEEQEPSAPRPFRVCENCGQLTPSSAPQCAYCGAVSSRVIAELQAGNEQRFLNDLFTRAAPVTPIIIGINIAIYLLMTFAAGGEFGQTLVRGADHSTLLAFGAQTNELLRNGEWFRLITPAFVHIGLIHIGMNSYVLWTIGPLVEKLYGSSRYLLIYLLTAAGGSFASFINHGLKNDSFGASAGASGAIFGLFGVVAVFSYKYRNELPSSFIKALKSSILPAIAINLVIGFSIKIVDNAAHIGGLLTGAVLALVIPYIPTNNVRRVSPFGLAILSLCFVVVFTSFALAYRRSGPHLTRRASKVESLLDNFSAADRAMVNVFRSAGQDNSWKPSQQDIAQLTAVAAALEKSIAPDEKTEQLRLELLRLLREQREIISRDNGTPLDDQLNANGEAFLKFRQSYREWLRTEGSKYGFTLRESTDRKEYQKDGSKEQPKK